MFFVKNNTFLLFPQPLTNLFPAPVSKNLASHERKNCDNKKKKDKHGKYLWKRASDISEGSSNLPTWKHLYFNVWVAICRVKKGLYRKLDLNLS